MHKLLVLVFLMLSTVPLSFVPISSARTSSTPIEDESAMVDNNPVELGKVRWRRDFDEALEKSRTEDKPLLVLFQEVPG